MLRAALATLSIITCVRTFIIPEEIPTLLSVVYSNIPPIKLGFDTRFGIGFRIGPHADFQTLIEIGPQENTNPIGMGNDNLVKRQSISGKQYKRNREDKKSRPELNEISNQVEKEAFPYVLANILFGRNWMKQQNSYSGGIQFKTIPGIDDVKTTTRKAMKSEKSKTNATTKIL